MNRILKSLLLAISISALMIVPTASAVVGIPDPCNSSDPHLSLANCQSGSESASPKPTSPLAPSTSASPVSAASPSAPASKPSTAAEEWGVDSAKSVGGVASRMKDAYHRQATPTWRTVVPYAFTWAIGMVIFAVALVVSVARAARLNPKARAELRPQAVKLVTYYPVMMMLPMVLKWAVDTMAGVSEGLVAQSGKSFDQFILAFGEQVMKDPLSFVVGTLGGAVAGLLLLLPVLGFMLMWLIFDITSQVGVQLLMVLMPITGALSLFPNSFQRWSSRAIGFTLGCLLTPVVTRFTFWVMWLIAGDQVTNSANVFHALLIILVVVFMCSAAPIMLGYVMPMLLPQASAVYGGGGGSAGHAGQDMIDRAWGGTRSLFNRIGGGDAGKGAANAAGKEAASQASAAKGAGGTAGGTAGGGAAIAGGALLGGAALLVVGAQKVGEMVESGSKNAAAQQLQGGGGGTSAADRAPSVLPRNGRMPRYQGGGVRGRGSDADGDDEGYVDASVVDSGYHDAEYVDSGYEGYGSADVDYVDAGVVKDPPTSGEPQRAPRRIRADAQVPSGWENRVPKRGPASPPRRPDSR